MLLTIHTPAYNRAHTLTRTWESLRKQTRKDFVWIITDDGSTDDTAGVVARFQSRDDGFPIVYNPIPHGGIPRAMNAGAALCRTEWLLRLDSDDWLLPDAVARIYACLPQAEGLGGIAFGKCRPDGRWMKDKTPKMDPVKGYVDAPNTQRAAYNLDQDMSEVLRTRLLREFSHPCWPGEYFAPEQLCLNDMALAGWKIRWFPQMICVCEYLPDGQTRNDRIVKDNPMGFAMMYNQNILLADSFRQKCRCAMQMTALAICGKHPCYLLKTNSPAATLLTLPLGMVLSLRRRRQYRRL